MTVSKHFWFVVFSTLLLTFASCGKKPVTTAEPVSAQEPAPKPHWVSGKPASSIYFYGIGVATKRPGNSDHLETAKKNALNDLASEIKVNVSSNSILYTLERDYKFQSEFIETIRTTTDQDIEGYEIADSWEDDRQYWIFYRLNRADFYAAKEAKKRGVMKNSADFYRSAVQAWKNGQVTAAFDMQVRALTLMKPYWAESNEYEVDGEILLLDNAILNQLQEMANNLELIANPKEVTLNLSNQFSEVCRITARQKNSGEPLAAVPIQYQFRSSTGLIRDSRNTSNNGQLNVSIENPDRMATYNELRANIELEKLFDPRALDRDLLRLVRGLPSPDLKVQIHFVSPVIFIESQEQNLHFRELLSHLRDHLSNEIIKNGLPVSQNRNQADIIVRIEGKTREGGESSGFSIAYLNMNIRFTDKSGQKVFYEESFNDVKGVSNSFERAGLRAFDKGKEQINRTFMNKALDTIF
jgi:hypothetical protein